MSAIVGTRDKRLQASAERFSTTADGKAILMSGATPVFRVDSSGAGSPASIAITAKPVNVVGDIVFSVSTGTTLVIDGNVATVDFAGMKTDTVTVQARIREFGVDYIASYIISKVFDGVAGDTGLAGINTAQAFAYKRAAVAPVDSPGDVVYTFASAAITAPAGNDLANGWSKNIPAGTAPLYVRVAGASSRNATDNIAANEWAAAVLLARDGAAGADGAAGVAGADGMNTAQAFAYKRAAVAPVDSPGDVVYTFSTAAISTPAGNGLANGWSKTIPAGTAPLYVRVAAASSRSATDAIAANEWTAAVLLAQDGTAGQNGQNGLNVAPVRIYQRAVANVAPALPSAACTFTFATGVLTGLNNGWSTQVPTAGGAYLFTSGATAASTAATDDIPAVEWAAAARMAADGAAGVAGADGMNTAQAFAYKRAASAPVDSPGDVVYTFSSAAITMPVDNDLANGWTKTIPAGTAPLYVRVAAASSRSATDGIAANEWTAAVLLAQDGPPGLNGVNVAPVRIYQRAAVNVAPALPSATCTLTFATGVLTGLNNGWSTQVPTAGGAYLFTSGATAASTAATDDIPAGEWAAAARMAADGAAGADGTNGSNGANGVDGLNVAPVRIYQRGATNIAPALPSAACTFTFATGALTGLNNGWSTQVPTAGGAYLFTSGATAASRGATDGIPASEWSAAARLAADGATGQRGTVTVTAPGYSTWSDASALYELGHAGYGAPINRDVVTLYDATHAVTKYYQGGSWYVLGTYIDGNLLVQGSIATQALGAESVTAAKIDARGLVIKDPDGNVILGAGTPLTANHMNAGIGAGNLISNSGPYPGTVGGFGLVQTYSPGTTTFGASDTAYVPTGAGGVFIQCSGVVPAGSVATLAAKQGADFRKFPVTAGVRYELTAYVSTHRCKGAVNLAFYTASGAYIAEFTGNNVDNSLSTGPLSAWPRSVVFATAPVGAAYAAVRAVLFGNGGTNAYLFTSLWYFGVALSAQTVPSAWADGPGAGFGDNIYGQITPSNSPTYIANAAIVNAQIGGDIYSSNWNGSTTGWLLDRNGNFYANSGTFRGALSGRNVTAENLATDMALIGTVIRSKTYSPGSYGWMINADGTAEFSALSITGRPTGPVYGQSDMTSYPVLLVTLGSATGIAAAHKVTVQIDGQVTTAAASGSSVTISLYWGSVAGSETTLIKSWTASARGLGSGVWEDEILPFVEQVTVSVPADASRTGSGAYFKALATRTGSSTSGTDASLQISTNIKNPTA